MFQKVRVGKVSEEVVKQVQEAIFAGVLEPGDRLPPERELAEQFGLSRMSVRLALHTLESAGLVEIRVGSNGGAFVREPNFDPLRETLASMLRSKRASILDLAEARKIVETATAELAAQRATDGDLQALRTVVEAARRSLESGNVNYGPHSVNFHAALARAAKNRVLDLTVQSFRGLFSDVLEKFLPTRDMAEKAVADHWELYQAIAAHDSRRARELMSDHLAYFETRVKALGEDVFDRLNVDNCRRGL